MSIDKFSSRGLTFDDVLLVPLKSDVLPQQTDVRTRITDSLSLSVPLMSSPMDTVTESDLAIALAREGGLGIIHRNLPIDKQVAEVDKVKRTQSGMIIDPITLGADALLSDALEIMRKYHISGRSDHGALWQTRRNLDQPRHQVLPRRRHAGFAADDQ